MSYKREIWKSIPTFPRYDASSFGRIRSHLHWLNTPIPRILHVYRRPDNSLNVSLSKNKKVYTKTVHRLVALTFFGYPLHNRNEVNHRDSNRLNNHVSNLEYVSRKENALHARMNHLYAHGEQVHSAKLSANNIKQILQLAKNGLERRVIAKRFHVHRHHILIILRGIRWKHITKGKRCPLPIVACPHCFHRWNPSFHTEQSVISKCHKCRRNIPSISYASPRLKFASPIPLRIQDRAE